MGKAIAILHIEDSLSDVELIGFELSESMPNTTVKHVDNKEDFIEQLSTVEYDLVLSDFNIPGFVGLEIYNEFKKFNFKIPFIFVSGTIGEERVVDILRAGVTDYVLKSNLRKIPIVIDRAINECESEAFQIKAEQLIRDNEQKYRGIFEKMNEGLMLSDLNGKITVINPQLCQLIGATTHSLIGVNVNDIIGGEVIQQLEIQEENGGESSLFIETELITQKKSVVNIFASISMNYDSTEEAIGHMFLITDITERKIAEKKAIQIRENFTNELEKQVHERTVELDNAKKVLAISLENERRLGDMKSRFISTASHQFRTPLSIIQSNISTLLMGPSEQNEGFKDRCELVYGRVKTQITKMTEMMDDVLILSKINLGNVTTSFEKLDLIEVCEEIIHGYSQIDDSIDVNLKVSGDPVHVELDLKLLDHVISNILSNAIKYSGDNSEINVFIDFDSDHFKIRIKDSGIGIPKDSMEHLFEPFYRAENASNISGTGLGMSIVKEYVQLNNGEINVFSELGVGTEVIIAFQKQ
jgi:PAS domain S-box-containing protein